MGIDENGEDVQFTFDLMAARQDRHAKEAEAEAQAIKEAKIAQAVAEQQTQDALDVCEKRRHEVCDHGRRRIIIRGRAGRDEHLVREDSTHPDEYSSIGRKRTRYD